MKRKYSKIAKRVKDLIEEHILGEYDVTLEEEKGVAAGMRYDFCLPYLSEAVAFEADGIQHSKFVPFFHRDKQGFEEAKARDFNKDFITHRRGGHIIRISDIKITDEEFLELIEPYVDLFEGGDVNVPKWVKKK